MQTGKTLDVYYHGKLVGTLAETPDKRIAFQYSSEWQRTGFPISPFSLPLRNDVFVPNERSVERFDGLFGVFADSLPDSWGGLLLDRYLQTVGINRGDISTLDRLAYIGKSGMGALEYFPSKETEYNLHDIGMDYDTIAKECGNILTSKYSDQLDILYKLGGSSGGTRPKINIKDENGKEWIVKFPAKTDPDISGKREYDYSLCAKDCGINMTETELIHSSICEGYFRTVRFDRKQGEKIFSITFAALLEADFRAPSCDYETYLKLVNVLTKENGNDVKQMFKTMCFNILTHNRDDHTKNFSFLYTNANGWHLAPSYDLTYSDTYWGEQTTSVAGKGKNITEKDLTRLGVKAGLPEDYCAQYYKEIADKTQILTPYLKKGSRRLSLHHKLSEHVKEISKTRSNEVGLSSESKER